MQRIRLRRKIEAAADPILSHFLFKFGGTVESHELAGVSEYMQSIAKQVLDQFTSISDNYIYIYIWIWYNSRQIVFHILCVSCMYIFCKWGNATASC